MADQRITRDTDRAMLGGVLAGLGRRYNLDPTLLRVVSVIATFPTGGLTIPLYLAAWLIIPKPEQVEAGTARPRVPRGEALDDLGDTARRAADRLAQAARTAAEAARTAAEAARAAAEEVAEIAHRPRQADGQTSTPGSQPATSQQPWPPPQPSQPGPPPQGSAGQPPAQPPPVPPPMPPAGEPRPADPASWAGASEPGQREEPPRP